MPEETTELEAAKAKSAAMADAELARRSTAWAIGMLAIGEVAGFDHFLASHYHWPLWVEIVVDLIVLVSTGWAIRRMFKAPLRVGSVKSKGMLK